MRSLQLNGRSARAIVTLFVSANAFDPTDSEPATRRPSGIIVLLFSRGDVPAFAAPRIDKGLQRRCKFRQHYRRQWLKKKQSRLPGEVDGLA